MLLSSLQEQIECWVGEDRLLDQFRRGRPLKFR
jgi:hypothetical protein